MSKIAPVTLQEVRGIWIDWTRKLEELNGRERWLEPTKRFLQDQNPWPKTLTANLRFDKRRLGWELREHVARTIASVAEVELVPFLRYKEEFVRGYDLIGRSRYDPLFVGTNLGQEDAEFLLAYQEEIPAEYRQFHLVFPGTIWRHPGGNLYVPFLYWHGDRWLLDWLWLEGDWGSRERLVRRK